MSKKTVYINPMYALAVNVADLRQRFVLFCGAGISKDAGVATGADILFDMKRKIFQQEKKTTTFTDEDVSEWLEKNKEYKELSYSQCLEILFPGIEQRRVYLNAFFEEKQPGNIHNTIAKLVKIGVFRFIITTNFDNLIEKALDEEGLKDKYSVISTNDQAIHSDSWDKVDVCRIYKMHGDKDQGLIRNTLKELDDLEEDLKQDFQEIINRHGVVVLGYSGSDPGVMACFQNRESLKYPIYWQYKNNIHDDVKKMIINQDGRLMQYETASNFLGELLDRIQIIHRTAIEGSGNVTSNRIRQILIQTNLKEVIVEIEDERTRFLNTVLTVYENLQTGAPWVEIWNAYSDVLEKFRPNLEFADQILKLNMYEAWEEFIKVFEGLHSINIDNDRYGRNGLINQLFYSILLIVGSRCLKHGGIKLARNVFALKRFIGERYTAILNWNIIGNFLDGKNESGEQKFYVPRLHFLLDLIEDKKFYPQNEKFVNIKNLILDFDIMCFVYSVRYSNSSDFRLWYPCSMYYFDYRTPEFFNKIKADEAYCKDMALNLFGIDSENFIKFLKEKAFVAYEDLAKRTPGFVSDSPFRVLFKEQD